VTPSFVGLGAFSVARAGDREGWYWDRTNCCLWFRTGAEEYCDNCSLLDPGTRSAQRMRELAEAAP
jgi:hypothetical protein